jgi:hypothetical protein
MPTLAEKRLEGGGVAAILRLKGDVSFASQDKYPSDAQRRLQWPVTGLRIAFSAIPPRMTALDYAKKAQT